MTTPEKIKIEGERRGLVASPYFSENDDAVVVPFHYKSFRHPQTGQPLIASLCALKGDDESAISFKFDNLERACEAAIKEATA